MAEQALSHLHGWRRLCQQGAERAERVSVAGVALADKERRGGVSAAPVRLELAPLALALFLRLRGFSGRTFWGTFRRDASLLSVI
jgi:hypothetical protein